MRTPAPSPLSTSTMTTAATAVLSGKIQKLTLDIQDLHKRISEARRKEEFARDIASNNERHLKLLNKIAKLQADENYSDRERHKRNLKIISLEEKVKDALDLARDAQDFQERIAKNLKEVEQQRQQHQRKLKQLRQRQQ